MKAFYTLVGLAILSIQICAQVPYNSAIQNGYTRKAMVSEQVGLTQVTITYHRPAVKGREGKIWGQLVHAGFVDQGFGSRKPAPWRAGANENTVIEFDNDVMIEGQPLLKGRYGLFIAYDPSESILILSKRSDAWGSFFYDEKDDALRVKVRPRPIDKPVEYLKYEFTEPTINSAIITLSWEKLSIPFKIGVDHLKQQFEALLTESQNPAGFTSQGLSIAAGWCLDNNYELERGLEWAKLASASTFPGNPISFPALSTKARILTKLGRMDEAAQVIKVALPLGSVSELQLFGRQLLTIGNKRSAMEVFEFNYNKNPNQFITLIGMVLGSSANGQAARALEFANKAIPLAPNDANKRAVQEMIDKLKAGKSLE